MCRAREAQSGRSNGAAIAEKINKARPARLVAACSSSPSALQRALGTARPGPNMQKTNNWIWLDMRETKSTRACSSSQLCCDDPGAHTVPVESRDFLWGEGRKRGAQSVHTVGVEENGSGGAAYWSSNAARCSQQRSVNGRRAVRAAAAAAAVLSMCGCPLRCK